MKWQPWQTVLRRAAAAEGFVDPIGLLARLRQFSQPAEIEHPIELLRAGVVMHARGLLNARIVQHNLDWRWPYWVRRQFNPRDPSFVPRAFSLTHINLTHRNWTAIGLPDVAEFPVVDPTGLFTVRWDGWSLDVWAQDKQGRWLVPGYATEVAQYMAPGPGLAVVTETRFGPHLALEVRAEAVRTQGTAQWQLTCSVAGPEAAWLVVAVRPFNPEGVSFITEIARNGNEWVVNDQDRIEFDTEPAAHAVSRYADGDVFNRWSDANALGQKVSCKHGLATAAAGFEVGADNTRSVVLRGALSSQTQAVRPPLDWPAALSGLCELSVPDDRYNALFEHAKRTLILLSPDEIYPGPYTYRRFWFRDAVFMLDAMLALGLNERATRALARFPSRQTLQGYFLSQDGEWDSNGEVLWLLERHSAILNSELEPSTLKMIRSAAQWIMRKRLPSRPASPHAGLLPPGFSAEHLGPNDYYYWDDFWSLAGLRAAATMLASTDKRGADEIAAAATHLLHCIDASLRHPAQRLQRPAMPASPYRRLDSGAVGSLVAGYPLQLLDAHDPRLLDTANFLLDNCVLGGGFVQDIIHSGINPYLTLHLAQVLLRAGDTRHLTLLRAVADLASSTGQWPEAIHPATGGGCMGDGQHGWASAEWVMMLRNCILREERDHLVLGAGICADWLASGRPITLGPTFTRFGSVSVSASGPVEAPRMSWHGSWHHAQPVIHIAIPGYVAVIAPPGGDSVTLRRLP